MDFDNYQPTDLNRGRQHTIPTSRAPPPIQPEAISFAGSFPRRQNQENAIQISIRTILFN
jgi:hypothetical protein